MRLGIARKMKKKDAAGIIKCSNDGGNDRGLLWMASSSTAVTEGEEEDAMDDELSLSRWIAILLQIVKVKFQ